MLIRKVLVIGVCNAQLVFSDFTPEDISVIGRKEELEWLLDARSNDFIIKVREVKAAIVIYDSIGKVIFERLANQNILCILILPIAKKDVRLSFIRKLFAQGAKGVFLDDFVNKPLEVQELYRQVKNLAT